MKIATLVFNPLAENTYVVWDDTLEAIVIDAGMYNDAENKALENFIEKHNLKPVMAVNTHGHFDHLLGVEWVRERYDVPFALSSKDMFLVEGCPSGSTRYGMTLSQMPSNFDIDLDSAEEITFGNTSLRVIQTPGHTPGHVSLYSADQKVLFTGDTLFRESIGRTDLPGGDYALLMSSILERVITLGDDVAVYSGHGESSDIGHETLYNPFIVEVINQEVSYK